jgi:peptidyl-prolyl cis-trans isomerase A (cyclophilin A)
MLRRFWIGLPLLLGLVLPSVARATLVEFTTPLGSFQVELFDSVAPNTVANFLEYVTRGLYEGAVIHRVEGLPDGKGGLTPFVVQGGRFYPLPDGKTDVPLVPQLHDEPFNNPVLKNEFIGTKNLRGTISMTLSGSNVDSATNEWFINLRDNSATFDPNKVVVFGEVTASGMDVVDALFSIQTYNFSVPFQALPLLPTYPVSDYFNGINPKAEDWVTYSVHVVPEPASVAMALGGAALIGGAVWRKRRRQSR